MKILLKMYNKLKKYMKIFIVKMIKNKVKFIN